MTLLDERELTAGERAAIADEPRPGVWIQDSRGPGYSEQPTGDGRALTQHETNILIGLELWMGSHYPDSHYIEAALGYRGSTNVQLEGVAGGWSFQQRGGIHDDPLIRLIAFRKWGDRDRQWFERARYRKRMASEPSSPGGPGGPCGPCSPPPELADSIHSVAPAPTLRSSAPTPPVTNITASPMGAANPPVRGSTVTARAVPPAGIVHHWYWPAPHL